MKMTMCERVVLILTVVVYGYHVTSGCGYVERCQEYDQYNSHGTSIQAKCDLLPDMDRCIRVRVFLMYDCDPSTQLYYTEYLNEQRYLCDHLKVFVVHQECLLSEELRYSQAHNCPYALDYIDAATDAATDEEFCSDVIDNLECHRTQVLQICESEEAADFEYNRRREILLLSMKKRQCVSSGLNVVVKFGLSVGAAGLFLIITPLLIGTTCKVYARRKRKRRVDKERQKKLSPASKIPTVETEVETPHYNPTYSSPPAVYAAIDEPQTPAHYATLAQKEPMATSKLDHRPILPLATSTNDYLTSPSLASSAYDYLTSPSLATSTYDYPTSPSLATSRYDYPTSPSLLTSRPDYLTIVEPDQEPLPVQNRVLK